MKWIIPIMLFSLCVASKQTVTAQSPSPIALQKVIPPTPEAAALGKFGSYPVGLFTGTPNVSIELYRLKAKGVELPIGITYSTNGLRVDEMPTKTGMSWVLNAGGAITRTVYDKPDDTYTKAGAAPTTDFGSNSVIDFSIPAWLENVNVNNLDTQFDEYNYNFNGYSGKFIIGPGGTPVSIPYSNIKIELSPLRITTPDGIQYYFGENGATEGSQLSSGSCGREDSRGAKSAWYLTRIVNPNDPSDNITITYSNGGYTYISNQNETITFWDNANTCTGNGGSGPTGDPCGCGPTPCIYGGLGSPNLGIDNFCANTETVSVPYVSEITSSLFGKIKFVYTSNIDLTTAGTPIENDKLLSSIQVFQNNNGTNLLKSYHFNYTFAKPSTSGKIISLDNKATETPNENVYRPFLSSVDELDNTAVVIKTHGFEYDDISHLTARLSSSQDYWGYFNGRQNLYSFIPGNADPVLNNNLLPLFKIADRNPDYTYAVKGMLTKVNFPTGGNTQFVYEGNTLVSAPPPATTHYSLVTSLQATSINHAATFYILRPTTVNIERSLYCCSNGVNTCAHAGNSLVWGQFNNVQSNVATTISEYSFAEYNQRGECSFSRTETITLQPGVYGLFVSGFDNYQLSLTVTKDQSSGGGIYQYDGYVPTTASLANYGGGVRVKQQIVYDPISQKSTTTNYQYSGIVFPYTPQYVNNISYKRQLQLDKIDQSCVAISESPCNEFKSCSYIQYSSNSTINTSGRGGSPVYYTSVTESTGDNFVLGGIEHSYTWFADASLVSQRGNFIAGSSAPSLSWKNGLETNQNVFRMVNGVKVYLKKTINTYVDDSRINNVFDQYITKLSGYVDPFTVATPYACADNVVFGFRMNVFDVIAYQTTQKWTYLSSKQEINYDQDGTNPVTTTTNFFYDNPAHAMQTRMETVNSKNIPLKSVSKYPGDEASVTNLNTSETDAITKLKTQNNLLLLESEQYNNNLLQRRVHFGYKDVATGIIKPDKIKAQVASNPIEPKILFTRYDTGGNLTEQQKADDVKEVYLWGYKSTYPVVKVIGSDYETVKAFIDQTILDNTATTDQQMRTELNKIRVGLANTKALITTYTYAPLIGLTSETDPNGKTMYYEYDNLQRVKLIRDQDGNILKTFDYKYQQNTN